tara:strand:+ start:69 stop:215 length:147 start_codon:yes stop_codon:yes gene_type:complete
MDCYLVVFFREALDDLRGLLTVSGGSPWRVGVPENPESVGIGWSDISK